MASSASAATVYGVVYNSGTDDSTVLTDLSWKDFQSQVAKQEGKGLRIVNVRTYAVDGQRLWAAVMRAGSGARAFIHDEEWGAFKKDTKTNEDKGLRMVSFDVFVGGGKRLYSAAFSAGTYAKDAIWDHEWDGLTKLWGDIENKNLRVADFRTYTDGGKRLYSIIFRAGTGGHAAIVGKEWNDFQKMAAPLEDKDALELSSFQVYQDGNQRLYAGIFLPNAAGHWLFIGDKEGITGATHEWAGQGARPLAITIYENGCKQSCANTAVMQKNKVDTAAGYDYGITMTKVHCNGLPNTCGTPKATDRVYYDWPVDAKSDGTDRILRVSALMGAHQIFTLPFNDTQVNHRGTWLYQPGQWHHAIDFLRPDHKTFKVLAAAPGRVIFSGYDSWSGNTMIVSHDVGTAKDVYRTIYMHLRNGPTNDCDAGWSQAVPPLKAAVTNATKPADKTAAQAALDKYTTFLNNTGCTEKASTRHLDASYWGTSGETMKANLVDKQVKAGEQLGWAGATAPGSCGCMDDAQPTAPNVHLHLFTAFKDTTDDTWYFTDPWGIYSTPDCYPAKDTDPVDLECEWFGSTFKNGRASYPP
jgi:hypothetical protein